jgi:ABC-type multidrug transport system ATPase subunit
VLIGVSEYTDDGLTDLPAAGTSVQDLHEVLTDPRATALEPQSCVAVTNPATADKLMRPVAASAAAAQDLLLVYFVGHGLLGGRGDLHLAISSTEPGLAWTALPYSQLADEVRKSDANIKIVILDCCFSGRATDVPLSDGTVEDLEIDGACVLASSSRTKKSFAPVGMRHTVFTGAMLDVLTEAMNMPGGPLPLADMFGRIRRKVKGAGYPEPQQSNTNTAALIALVSGTGADTSGPTVAVRPSSDSFRQRPPVTGHFTILLDNATVYSGYGRTRISAVTMSIRQGEVVAIIGPVGSGRSSLLQLILGQLILDAGKAILGPSGEDLTVDRSRTSVAFVPQSVDVYLDLTVREMLTYSARLRAPGLAKQEVRERVGQVLGEYGLDQIQWHLIKMISGVQMRRVSIACEVVGRRSILMLDEPTAGIDSGASDHIFRSCAASGDEGATVLLATSDLEALHHVDRVIAVARGGVVAYDGRPEGVFDALQAGDGPALMSALNLEPPYPGRAVAPRRLTQRRTRSVSSQWSWRGFGVLFCRHTLLMRRRFNMTLIGMALPVTIAGLIAMIGPHHADPAILCMVLVAFIATASGGQGFAEFANEERIWLRDWRSGVAAWPMVAAKLVSRLPTFALMAGGTATVIGIARPPSWPSGFLPSGALFAVAFLVALVSFGTGMLISSISNYQSRSRAFMSAFTALQIALCGGIFALPPSLAAAAAVLPSRLGYTTLMSFSSNLANQAVRDDALLGSGPLYLWLPVSGLIVLMIAVAFATRWSLERRWAN